MNDESLQQEIRKARGRFAAMAATYALGVFNDNFFKQAALLLAVAARKSHLQGYIAAVFTVPYLVFAAPAGWLADRFSKRTVVIGAKAMEVAAMICGAVGICLLNWNFILVMVFIMGAQACLFSPALNGSIPELYPEQYVTRANAILKGVVIATILVGVAGAGFALDLGGGEEVRGIPAGRLAIAAVVVGMSILGFLVSFRVPWRPAAAAHARFPWTGPIDTLAQLWQARKDSLLGTIIGADVFIWFVGTLQILVINEMGLSQFALSKSMTSGLVVSELVGIAVGGIIGGRFASGGRWHRVLAPSALVMAGAMGGIAGAAYLPNSSGHGVCLPQLVVVFALLGAAGLAGGMFMIPCESFIQVRPAPDRKGTVIAAANFAAFTGILVAGPTANLLTVSFRLAPTNSFGLLAILSLVVGGCLLIDLRRKDPQCSIGS